MFDNLSSRFGDIFDKLKGKGALKEEDVAAALREIRVALLEADVALPVAKEFCERVREKAVGEKVLKSVTPGQQVVKIVHDELIEMLGAEDTSLNLSAAPPVPLLMVGLQGSGKTTTSAKLGLRLKNKERKKVLMASLDVNRPAAQEQLEILGQQTNVPTLEIIKGQDPVSIAKRAMETGRKEGYDVVILDTAGRLSIDDALMAEVAAVRDAVNPSETLLVADSLTGQDAVETARNFNERIGLTGIVLTRVDGDARGGAALSMRSVTGQPIKFIGVGEGVDALEAFHADRIAGRILDMGDVVSLVERAAETIEQEDAEKMARKMLGGKFDLNDLSAQLDQIKKMGGMGGIMGMMPGMKKMKGMMDETNFDDQMITQQQALISSMTKQERENPNVLNASRRKRIAGGAGMEVQDLNKLLKQYQQMQTAMKRIKKMGLGGMMKSMLGGGMPDMNEMMDPSAAGGGAGDLLGPNPFDQGGMSGAGAIPGLPPMGGVGKATRPPMNKRKKKQLEKQKKKK